MFSPKSKPYNIQASCRLRLSERKSNRVDNEEHDIHVHCLIQESCSQNAINIQSFISNALMAIQCNLLMLIFGNYYFEIKLPDIRAASAASQKGSVQVKGIFSPTIHSQEKCRKIHFAGIIWIFTSIESLLVLDGASASG